MVIAQGENMALPECFCWTRFGAEAGQSVEQIFARKEQERATNRGRFFWGIGNAIGPSMLALLQQTRSPEVLFSPIRSAPRREDAMPSNVVAWTEAKTLGGKGYQLPEQSLITSRLDPQRPRSKHFALVCYTESPLTMHVPGDSIPFAMVRNLLTNRTVGASQVTCVVSLEFDTSPKTNLTYNVVLRARLVPPYYIELRAPIPLSSPSNEACWGEVVGAAWEKRKKELTLAS